MVDVNAQIDAVTRSVDTVELDGDDAYVQTLAQEYASPIDDVWDAVTNPERIPHWFLPVSGDLRLGGRYQLEGNAGGEVLECAPPSDGAAHYRITWEYGGGASWVVVRLRRPVPTRRASSSSTPPARPTSRPGSGTSSVPAPRESAGTAACSASRCTSRAAAI